MHGLPALRLRLSLLLLVIVLVSRRQSSALRSPAGLGTVAAAALVTGLIVHARARQAEAADPPRGRFVEVDGVRLHYVEYGAGEPLVIFHGNGSMSEEFVLSGLVTLAAERFRVIVFDRPGYGYSQRPHGKVWTPAAQADLLIGALAQISVSRVITLGHSWGALVAIAAALRNPEAARGLVLESGYYYPTPRADLALFSMAAMPLIGDALRYTVYPLAARLLWPIMVRNLFSPAAVTPSFARFPLSMAMRPSQLYASAAESALLVPEAAALRKHYRELRMPVAIIAGIGDRMVDVNGQSRRLHAEVLQSSLHLVEECGHMVHHTAPERVLAALEEVCRAARESRF